MARRPNRGTPAGARQGNKWLTSMLIEAADSAARSKNTNLAAQQAQIASGRGARRAPQVAVPHSRVASDFYVLERDGPHHR